MNSPCPLPQTLTHPSVRQTLIEAELDRMSAALRQYRTTPRTLDSLADLLTALSISGDRLDVLIEEQDARSAALALDELYLARHAQHLNGPAGSYTYTKEEEARTVTVDEAVGGLGPEASAAEEAEMS